MKRKNKRKMFLAVLTIFAFSMIAHVTPLPAEAGTAPGVEVSVDISPEMKGRTTPDQAVFVFAKAMRGPKAPLAAVKAHVSDLPLKVTLDDSQAIAPMFKLSRFRDVEISARVSKSGQAMKQSGDIEGVVRNVRVGGAPVSVTIDSLVP